MGHSKFQELVGELYTLVGELESMFPGCPFTPEAYWGAVLVNAWAEISEKKTINPEFSGTRKGCSDEQRII